MMGSDPGQTDGSDEALLADAEAAAEAAVVAAADPSAVAALVAILSRGKRYSNQAAFAAPQHTGVHGSGGDRGVVGVHVRPPDRARPADHFDGEGESMLAAQRSDEPAGRCLARQRDDAEIG